jgi:hypothetical protein
MLRVHVASKILFLSITHLNFSKDGHSATEQPGVSESCYIANTSVLSTVLVEVYWAFNSTINVVE